MALTARSLAVICVCAAVIISSLSQSTEAKRPRLRRIKKSAPVIDDYDVDLTGNCPPPPGGPHTLATCSGDEFFRSCSVKCDSGWVFPERTNNFAFNVECDETEGVWKANGENAAVPLCKAVCPIGCQNGGTCTAPDVCTCPPEWTGKDCGTPVPRLCPRISTPINSVMTAQSGHKVGARAIAACDPGFFFPNGKSVLTYECVSKSTGGEGVWKPVEGQGDGLPVGKFPDKCEKAFCDPPCMNGGVCVGADRCRCPDGFRGPKCQFALQDCECPVAPRNGSVLKHFSDDGEVTFCSFQCAAGFVPSGINTEFNCREDGKWHPAISNFPRCDRITSTTTTTTTRPPTPPTPSTPTPPKSDGYCATWCGANYRTFDAKRYSFNGKCRYVLAKDCVDESFEIQIVNDPLCDEGSDCHRALVIKAGSTTLHLEYSEGLVRVANHISTYSIPYIDNNMEIHEVGSMVEVSDDLGFQIIWDKKEFVSIQLTNENLRSKMCGLCGNFDGLSSNDFKTMDGADAPTAIDYGVSCKVPGNKDCDDKAVASYCNDDKRAQARKVCDNLKGGNFTKCNDIVSPDNFMETCIESHCHYGDDGRNLFAACCAFEAYVRECSRKGGKVPDESSWRNEDFCPGKCPSGQIYDDCGSNCVATCDNQNSKCSNTECVEGCRCPTGTVLHEGRCIVPDVCPCVDGGKIFEKGSSIKKDCNTCTCKSGSWSCTENICDATCEGNGDPHYKTFDGMNYDFMGDCKYYLLHSDDVEILVENRKCGSHLTCTKSLTVLVAGDEIVAMQNKIIQLNGDGPKARPAFKTDDVFYHPASSSWDQLDLFNLGVAVQWDAQMSFKVTVPASFFNRTKGLCGTFNHVQKDDFLTLEGDIETTPEAFGDKWRVLQDCPGQTPVPTTCSDKQMEDAEAICDVIKGDAFKNCHDAVDVATDYHNCLVDVCNCDKKNVGDCFCDNLGRYADSCAKRGHAVGNWRSKVEKCSAECPPGQTFDPCVDNCRTSCRAISLGTSDCKSLCTEGCSCPAGQALNRDGACVAVGDCECHFNGHDYGKGQTVVRKNEAGQWELCTCQGLNWKCIITIPPTCKENERVTNCFNKECEATCSNMDQNRLCGTSDSCSWGCECKGGFVRNSNGSCVPHSECSCKHSDKTYPPGGTYKQDCNTCTCERGKWKCTKCPCSGTCTSWGDSHFTTFDGKKYDFKGDCEYILAQGKKTKNEADFQIIIKNVPCGSSGVTCTKSITLTVFNKNNNTVRFKVKLTRGERTLPPSTPGLAIRQVGLYVYVNARVEGISLLWDWGTLLYVRLDGYHQNRVEGLCGNFNGDSEDDLKPPNGGNAISPSYEFGNYWTVNAAKCSNTEEQPEGKCSNDQKHSWAKQKCDVMRGELFKDCHSFVNPTPYFDRCVSDTCACDFGGTCECMCTAITVYAEECARAGVPIKWRSQELCPIQCPCAEHNATTECPCYNPCIKLRPPLSCFNRLKEEKRCDKESFCVEGCSAKECPPKFIKNDNGTCIFEKDCIHCGLNSSGQLILEGDIMSDPCCTCQRKDNGSLTEVCFTDASIRLSKPIPLKDATEEGARRLNICENKKREGIIRGFIPEGVDQARVRCQCCPEVGPPPSCPPTHKPKFIEEDDKCSRWECVCDLAQCPVIKPECSYGPSGNPCCPDKAICPVEPPLRDVCEDEVKVCKYIDDNNCGVNCSKCEIQCKSCAKEPIPTCPDCQEVITIPSSGKCGGCCPKFQCVKKPCQVYPPVSCDNCSTVVREKDNCNCSKPEICQRKQCPVVTPVTCDPCHEDLLVDDGNGCGCKKRICHKKVCPAIVIPKCNACEEPTEEKDSCNCSSFKCVRRICPVYPTISCNQKCDKLSKILDPCGCEKPVCEEHKCDPVVRPNCTDCETEKIENDICGCPRIKCVPKECTVFPPLTCDSCSDLVESKDDCNCPKPSQCVKRLCPTKAPVVCTDCQTKEEVDDGNGCGCKIDKCIDYICPKYPDVNCSTCQEKKNYITKCGCWEPKCEKKLCPTSPTPTCNTTCNSIEYPAVDQCGCVGPAECKKNPCPTHEIPTCNDCQVPEVQEYGSCGCKKTICVDAACPIYPTTSCTICQKPKITQDNCGCSKAICEDLPDPNEVKPTCRPCETVAEYKDQCGFTHYSCQKAVCPNIEITTCSPCQTLHTKIDDCNCTYFAECVQNACPTETPLVCNSCEDKIAIGGHCGCFTHTCSRKPCPNEPSPKCGECETLKEVRDDCNCSKQVCQAHTCPPISTPGCNLPCEELFIPKDRCNCEVDGICIKKPCPTSVTPTCNVCQNLTTKLSEPCDCPKEVCEDLICPTYPIPDCSECEGPQTEKDNCGCSRQVCKKVVYPIPTPPVCSTCETLNKVTGNCGKIQYFCSKLTCPTVNITDCGPCNVLTHKKTECNCTIPVCEAKVCPPTIVPPTCPPCEELHETKECGCSVYSCKRSECSTPTAPTCDLCQIPTERRDHCGCEYKACDKKPCPVTHTLNCTDCERVNTSRTECGCIIENCVKKDCVLYQDPECDKNCESLQKPKPDACGCIGPSSCKKVPCPIYPSPTCNICQEPKVELTEPCGCNRTVCKRKACPTYPTPTCNDCQQSDVVQDGCDCDKITCVDKIFPPIVKPTCAPCEELTEYKNHCNVTHYACRREVCPDITLPTCTPCQELRTKNTSCGCLYFAECVPKPCEIFPVPTCSSCEEPYTDMVDCGCPIIKCKRKPCENRPSPNCTDCQVITSSTDECGCTEQFCEKQKCKPLPTAPPTCGVCEVATIEKDKCQCDEWKCERAKCATTETPVCDSLCQEILTEKDVCDCPTSKCRDKTCPDPVMPNCSPCKSVTNSTNQCGCLILECKIKICPTPIPVSCSTCEQPDTEQDVCGCDQNTCKKKVCPTLPIPTCLDCEEPVLEKDECGCNKWVCRKEECTYFPLPNCTNCQVGRLIKDKCGCPIPVCDKKTCPPPSNKTCPSCDEPFTDYDECGCEERKCRKRPCATPSPPACTECQLLKEEVVDCDCKVSKCVKKDCISWPKPNCTECQERSVEYDPCGCPNEVCVPLTCPTPTLPACGDCQTPQQMEGMCGCKINYCKAMNYSEECIINGVSHPIGATWPNPFDLKCGVCKCIKGDKCMGAKTECESPSKNCTVTCKSGEWYYPPTKEECANSCGPCCGKCGPPKCNAEDDFIPADKTVGLLKTVKSNQGKRGVAQINCTNRDQIFGLRRCSGACGKSQFEHWTLLPHTDCKCCKPTKTEVKTVKMYCEDDTTYIQSVTNPTVCDCVICDQDFGGKKRELN